MCSLSAACLQRQVGLEAPCSHSLGKHGEALCLQVKYTPKPCVARGQYGLDCALALVCRSHAHSMPVLDKGPFRGQLRLNEVMGVAP